ncbi:MAG: hypothetical protein D6714_19360, partial [Bacteroidetes bacterium]
IGAHKIKTAGLRETDQFFLWRRHGKERIFFKNTHNYPVKIKLRDPTCRQARNFIFLMAKWPPVFVLYRSKVSSPFNISSTSPN